MIVRCCNGELFLGKGTFGMCPLKKDLFFSLMGEKILQVKQNYSLDAKGFRSSIHCDQLACHLTDISITSLKGFHPELFTKMNQEHIYSHFLYCAHGFGSTWSTRCLTLGEPTSIGIVGEKRGRKNTYYYILPIMPSCYDINKTIWFKNLTFKSIQFGISFMRLLVGAPSLREPRSQALNGHWIT